MMPPAFPPGIKAEPIPGYPRFRISRNGEIWTWGWRRKWHRLESYTDSEGNKSVWMNDPHTESPVGAGGHDCGQREIVSELVRKTYGPVTQR